MRILNKKAQVSTTLSWMITILILTIILLTFFFVSNAIAGIKNFSKPLFSSSGEQNFGFGANINPEVTSNLLVFLNKKIVFFDRPMSFFDFLEKYLADNKDNDLECYFKEYGSGLIGEASFFINSQIITWPQAEECESVLLHKEVGFLLKSERHLLGFNFYNCALSERLSQISEDSPDKLKEKIKTMKLENDIYDSECININSLINQEVKNVQ